MDGQALTGPQLDEQKRDKQEVRGQKARERIVSLRKRMKENKMAAYIVPTEDFHGSEYVGDYFKAREYLSGFTGSAGTLVVLENEALLWTDGRYFLQAEEQLAGSSITLMRSGQPGIPEIGEYLREHLSTGDRVGFDGRTVSSVFVKRLVRATREKQISFCGKSDLAGDIWENRPAISKKPVWELPLEYAGAARREKLAAVREKLRAEGADILLLTALDEIAWLLNLRGADVLYTPVFLAYMVISGERAQLFVHGEILSEEIRGSLEADGITILRYEDIDRGIAKIPAGTTVWLDESKVNYHIVYLLPEGVNLRKKASPLESMKAVKTKTEQENIRRAHIRDGVAVTRFIKWLKENVAKREITELDAAAKLLEFRKEMDGFLEQSFSPIIAYGAHGAIIHYETTKDSDVRIEPKGMCLADTGGHYREGTTDITRTIVLGALTEQERESFTRVLMGHLNISGAKFAYGVSGVNLDYLAREPLWEVGMDFNHGTGHGVGYILSVHEGPQRIHWHIKNGETPVPFEEGMIVSNEPGLYIPGEFGIRHENLLLCVEAEETEYGRFMEFENLTCVPFDLEGIDVNLMTKRQIHLLNAYHARVYNLLAPHMTEEEVKWLAETTRPVNVVSAS